MPARRRMQELSACERLLFQLTEHYVRVYPDCAFRLTFDDRALPVCGTAGRTVSVAIRAAPATCRRIFTEGSLGLGEAYCDGNISVADDDYHDFLLLLVRAVRDRRLQHALPLADRLRLHRAARRCRRFPAPDQAASVNAHYSLRCWFDNDDRANRFYRTWLDPATLQYSCGRWTPDVRTLEEAQHDKFAHYCRRLGIGAGSTGRKLLELGCGWGGFLLYAAERYGLDCTGITLSTAQGAHIAAEARRRGLEQRVRVLVRNVHEMSGAYDHIVGIGLLEHIAEPERLFAQVAGCLAPSGSALFHAMFHDRRGYRPDPWLVRYIFPGGAVPHIGRTARLLARQFRLVSRDDLPPLSYARTLHCWYDTFCRRETEIRAILSESDGLDVDRAVRVFKHYLALAEAGLTVDDLVSNFLVRDPRRD